MLNFIFAAHSAIAQSLYEMPQGIESRMASGENPTGENYLDKTTNNLPSIDAVEKRTAGL